MEAAKRAEKESHKVPQSERVKLLREAETIVTKDRNSSYGNPEDNFKQIAQLWSAYKKVQFTSHDVAIMSLLIKVARLHTTPNHRDSAVDIAGYAACLADIQALNSAQEKPFPVLSVQVDPAQGASVQGYEQFDRRNTSADRQMGKSQYDDFSRPSQSN